MSLGRSDVRTPRPPVPTSSQKAPPKRKQPDAQPPRQFNHHDFWILDADPASYGGRCEAPDSSQTSCDTGSE